MTGVGDDGAAHARTHKVFHVLRNSGDAEVILAGPFGEAEQEVGRVFVLHQLPGLVNDQNAPFLVALGLVPDVVQHDVHGDRAQFIL